ncbi:MAG: CBS domain-containing protein [Myxococcota bacterium]
MRIPEALRHAPHEPVIHHMLMLPPICGPRDSLERAAHRMHTGSTDCLLVVGQNHALLGILTRRDLAEAVFDAPEPLAEVPVERVMTKNLWTVSPSATLGEATHLMEVHQIRRIPVVDTDGRLLGLVSGR